MFEYKCSDCGNVATDKLDLYTLICPACSGICRKK